MAAARVISVHIGQIAPLGLVGDQQADLRVHGGPDKAIYGYSIIHYAAWRSEYPQHSDLLVPVASAKTSPLGSP